MQFLLCYSSASPWPSATALYGLCGKCTLWHLLAQPSILVPDLQSHRDRLPYIGSYPALIHCSQKMDAFTGSSSFLLLCNKLPQNWGLIPAPRHDSIHIAQLDGFPDPRGAGQGSGPGRRRLCFFGRSHGLEQASLGWHLS